jgi:phenylacetate-CoA oxygenase PaaI subunit
MSDSAVYQNVEQLPETLRMELANLLWALADSKQALGFRYAEWAAKAPVLEAGVAASAMAQAELGHARVLMMLLRGFPEVPLEVTNDDEGRRSDLHAPGFLDKSLASWPEFVAANLLFDGALTEMLEAMRHSTFEPLAGRMGKMLDEERFHAMHARDWFRRLGRQSDGTREALQAATDRLWPETICWFGRADDLDELARAGILDADALTLRARFVERITPLLNAGGVAVTLADDLPWACWDAVTRRLMDSLVGARQ